MPLEAEKTRFGCQADLVLVSTRKCRRGYERQEPAEPLQRSYTPCDGFLLSLKFAPILPQNVDRNDKFKDWNGNRDGGDPFTQLLQRKFE